MTKCSKTKEGIVANVIAAYYTPTEHKLEACNSKKIYIYIFKAAKSLITGSCVVLVSPSLLTQLLQKFKAPLQMN